MAKAYHDEFDAALNSFLLSLLLSLFPSFLNFVFSFRLLYLGVSLALFPSFLNFLFSFRLLYLGVSLAPFPSFPNFVVSFRLLCMLGALLATLYSLPAALPCRLKNFLLLAVVIGYAGAPGHAKAYAEDENI